MRSDAVYRWAGAVVGILVLLALIGWNALSAFYLLVAGTVRAGAIGYLIVLLACLWLPPRIIRGWAWGGYVLLLLVLATFAWRWAAHALGWSVVNLGDRWPQ